MAKLGDIVRGAKLNGVLPGETITAVDVKWLGQDVIDLTYEDSHGRRDGLLLYRKDEPDLEIQRPESLWGFDGDPALFQLVSEARRLKLAWLSDPMLAVHTSRIEPLPHQITAVYEAMLPKHPLRFLLADDPGAGKTIMTGLLIKELEARGDLRKCLIVCPGNLCDQWQDELEDRFHIDFTRMPKDADDVSRTGNWFKENDLAICRLDKLSRSAELQEKLRETRWDLVVCDEAHKMSASVWKGEIHKTARRKLGDLLSTITRNFLLLTATPHNGKEEDFQIFMSLLDPDRFEGKPHGDQPTPDVKDLMRRMVKEELLKFDGHKLFPERLAHTVEYELSPNEAALYEKVTAYVREEFNRADKLKNAGRKNTVGFALTVLQRRLASSPEAIYQSLRRRHERLEKQRQEAEAAKEGTAMPWPPDMPRVSDDYLDDLDDAPDDEMEEAEDKVTDSATAAQTIAELKAEIARLADLEKEALALCRSKTDRKWDELSKLLQDKTAMEDGLGHRRKLIIFTEQRDTLNYLHKRIGSLLGRPESLAIIHGAMGRKERAREEERFTQDKDVELLLATDAAGEGINLQRAHLMINYDLPWNPNRLEQRFGRIHRIGQTEVCQCWNLVASQTREGQVYLHLLKKLENISEATGGRVFNILGELRFDGKPLRDILREAIRYGESPEVKARFNEIVDEATENDRIRALLDSCALTHDFMDAGHVFTIRDEMDRAVAKTLQPQYVAAFFKTAFKALGGTLREREKNRFEATHVPAVVRNRAKSLGRRHPVLDKYERLTFETGLITVDGKPPAEYVFPGHPLMDSVIDLTLERQGHLLKCGATYVDPAATDEEVRLLVYFEHAITDASQDENGQRHVVSRRMQFVEFGVSGQIRKAGPAPYLDYRPLNQDEAPLLAQLPPLPWPREEIEAKSLGYAATNLVPAHVREVQALREAQVDKTMAAVKEHLVSEITYWSNLAAQLRENEQNGQESTKMTSAEAERMADELDDRLKSRMERLKNERHLKAQPLSVISCARVIPLPLLQKLAGHPQPAEHAAETRQSELTAMEAVMAAERKLGFVPRDVSADKCGYDIESADPSSHEHLRFIEVKGRAKGAATVTVTHNEIRTAINLKEKFILALVLLDGGQARDVVYVRQPFTQPPELGVAACDFKISHLLSLGENLR